MSSPQKPFPVSSTTPPASLAGAISKRLREQHQNGDKTDVSLQCIGAGAVNQAMKAWAIARGYVASSGFDIVGEPSFVDLDVQDDTKTGLKFRLRLVDRGV